MFRSYLTSNVSHIQPEDQQCDSFILFLPKFMKERGKKKHSFGLGTIVLMNCNIFHRLHFQFKLYNGMSYPVYNNLLFV